MAPSHILGVFDLSDCSVRAINKTEVSCACQATGSWGKANKTLACALVCSLVCQAKWSNRYPYFRDKDRLELRQLTDSVSQLDIFCARWIVKLATCCLTCLGDHHEHVCFCIVFAWPNEDERLGFPFQCACQSGIGGNDAKASRL